MTLGEYMTWAAEYAREPWGENRADARTALHGANLASCWVKDVSVDHFLLSYKPKNNKALMRAKLEAWALEHNAKNKSREELHKVCQTALPQPQ